MTGSEYRPTVSAQQAEAIRRWHDAAYAELRRKTDARVRYLDRDFDVPAEVFPPAPMSQLLGRAVLAEVRPADRVLDMGTGTGVNAILAASVATDVTGVDINPYAVQSATANAVLNGVSERTRFFVSDVFDAVDGTFDLIIIDPPFRWFAPRDLLEASMTDEKYRTLTRFMTQAGDYLSAAGRILVFFGTSGDLDYLYRLTECAGFRREIIATQSLTRGEVTVDYVTLRLTR